MPACKVQNFDQLPAAMKVDDMAAALGISKRLAWKIAHSKDFPAALRVGEKRVIIVRDKFLLWLEQGAGKR